MMIDVKNTNRNIIIDLTRLCFALVIGMSTMTESLAKDNAVTIAMSTTPLSAPFIIAEENGYFLEENLNVTIKEYKGGHRSFKAMLEGEADIATSSEAVVMFNSFKRDDFVLFCTFVTSDNDVKILARQDSGITTIEHLAGRKVGTILGSSAHFFLSQALLTHGVAENTVQQVSLNPEDAPDMLQQNKLDAVVTWEPYAYISKQRLGKDIIEVQHDRNYLESFNALVMREYAENNPDVLQAIIKALAQATDYLNKEKMNSQQIIAKRLNKDIDMIKTTWNDFNYELGLNQWMITSLESEARWAIEHGFIKSDEIPDYVHYLHLQPLERISPESISVYR